MFVSLDRRYGLNEHRNGISIRTRRMTDPVADKMVRPCSSKHLESRVPIAICCASGNHMVAP